MSAKTEREAADAAFVNAGLHEFNGKPLEPLVPLRQMAAKNMGMKFPLINEEDKEYFDREVPKKKRGGGVEIVVERDFVHRQLFQDMVITIWLCTLKKVSEVHKARRDPESALTQALSWAEKNQLNYGTQLYIDGSLLFYKMWGEVFSSQSIPKSKDVDVDDDDEDDPPGE